MAKVNGTLRDFTIKKVLYVPKIGINLFSIAAATEMGMRAMFIDNKCHIFKNNQLVLTGERAARTMYHLNIKSKELANSAQLMITLETAHQRLGHANCRQIKRMFSMKLVEGLILKDTIEDNRVCSGCAVGKMQRKSYQSSKSPKADCIAGRVHSDVCGPMHQTSLEGARYFVTFKDEYSGWLTTNFMKSKTEVLSHLKAFHAFLINQTGHSIKILRSDQGTEYINVATTEWIQKMGILHEKKRPIYS